MAETNSRAAGGGKHVGISGPGWRQRQQSETETLGWSSCLCPPIEIDGKDVTKWRPGIVLDPFLGSGTTALVARRLGRHCVGIELNPTYAELAAKRLSQLSLLAEGAVHVP